MNASKFSNFTIDYILGENTRPHTQPVDSPGASQVSRGRGEFSEVNLLSPSGFPSQTRGGAVMGLQPPCPGIFDVAPYYNTFSRCGQVAYYQANFSLNYCGSEQWFHAHSGCDKEEAHCYQSGQQRQRNRIRTVFTENQTKQLDQLYSITEYPSVEARAELAKNTGLSEETVRVWFKNRRARRKRQKPSSDLHQMDLV